MTRAVAFLSFPAPHNLQVPKLNSICSSLSLLSTYLVDLQHLVKELNPKECSVQRLVFTNRGGQDHAPRSTGLGQPPPLKHHVCLDPGKLHFSCLPSKMQVDGAITCDEATTATGGGRGNVMELVPALKGLPTGRTQATPHMPFG